MFIVTWTSSRFPNKRRRRHLRAPCLSPVIVRRWACPASSEVHADFVRKRACPSSSEVHADIARKKGCVQSFLLRSTQRRRRCTRGSCEEEGKRAIPLPPRKPRSTQRKTLDLGGWRACLSTPRETHNQRTTDANIPNCATPQSAASKHPELCATHCTNRQTKHRNRNFAPMSTQETKHSIQMHQTPRTVRQENSHLHMLSRPQCVCILGDHQDWMALRQAI